MTPTPFDPNTLRLTLAIIFMGMAELFWDRNKSRRFLYAFGAVILWVSYLLHVTGVL